MYPELELIMERRKLWFLCSLIMVGVSAALLLTGSQILLYPLHESENIPLGTFTTWAGIICLPLSVYLGIKELRKPSSIMNKILASLLKGILSLSILWAPISYLLAGNFSFTFSGTEDLQGGQEAMKIFWVFSYSIVIGTLLIFVLYWLKTIMNKGFQKPPNSS